MKIDKPGCMLFTFLTFRIQVFTCAVNLTSSDQHRWWQENLSAKKHLTAHQCACAYEFQTAGDLVFFQKY